MPRFRRPLMLAAATALSLASVTVAPGRGAASLNQPAVGIAADPAGDGYWLVARDGGVFPFGGAGGYGSTGGMHLNQPVVGMAATPSGHGYWLVASDGGIFPFGDAGGYGSTGGIHLNQPVVGMAATPSGHGYWLVASDGGIFPFGDAGGHGSTGGIHLNQPVVGMAATPSGHGYWLVASDGGIFPFGDAGGYGSTGGMHLNRAITGMASTASGRGYLLVASDGGIFPFGDATGAGSTGGIALGSPIVGAAISRSGGGYWLAEADGTVFPFGNAADLAPLGDAPCVGIPMLRGQADIDLAPAGTSFCLSGTHQWSLTPKAGDSLGGPAVLDGGGVLGVAVGGGAPGVTLADLTVQRYASPTQRGPIHPDVHAAGWTVRNLDVGWNAHAGLNGADGMQVLGGRIHDNGQEGIGTDVAAGMTVDGVEIDHNNSAHMDCGYEAGGIKLVGTDITVRNSRIHDNHCKGVWTDMNASGTVVTGNQVYGNDAEGIFIEISNHTTVRANTVWGNGFQTAPGGGCAWLWGGGITLASSAGVEVSGNAVSGNCNGITGTQQNRPDGTPGLLENVAVHDNAVSGPGSTGVAADNGANLASRNIVFTADTLSAGQRFCGLAC